MPPEPVVARSRTSATNSMTTNKIREVLRTRWKRLITSRLPYQPIRRGRQEWATEYASGQWDYLQSLSELTHYVVVAGYCHHFHPAVSVLDVGCGEGILRDKLCTHALTRYVGIDLSAEAIHRAAGRQDEKSQFVETDACTFHPDGSFDVIVFNECLYYFEDPVGLMQQYEAYLAWDGIFVISMTVIDRSRRIWKMLAGKYLILDEVMLTNRLGIQWLVNVCRIDRKSHDSAAVANH